VAVRRYRSTLRTFGPLLPADRTQALDERLRAWGARLGEVRDLEVLVETLTEHGAGETPLVRDVVAVLAGRRAGLLDDLADPGCAHLVGDATTYARDVEIARGNVKRLARRAGKRARKLLAGAGDDAARLHRARKAAKRARYAAEVVGDGDRARRHAHVQSHLGTHHDCATAIAHLQQAPAGAHDAVLMAADLGARADRARRAALGEEP
jgi:CHAD domain-containing protein